MIQSSIPTDKKDALLAELSTANKKFQQLYPGDKPDRQPVHTVYGGADLFRYNSSEKMGRVALDAFLKYAPNFIEFSKVLELIPFTSHVLSDQDIKDIEQALLKGSEHERHQNEYLLPFTVYNKIIQKLKSEPIEDFRIDFEDGFGNRSWEEEDNIAVQAATECAKGMDKKSLPPFIGIRIKPFTEDLKERGARTLDIFLSTLSNLTNGALPENFVVMLPKVSIPEQVETLVKLFEVIESNSLISAGAIKMEMMVETTQSIINAEGVNPLKQFVEASKGRMVATAFGTYDYTASCNITARYQDMGHDVCDFAHHFMKVALGSTGIWLSDGATNVMPIGPYRKENPTAAEELENKNTVHRNWKKAYDHTRHSLYKGLYQGWDLHPAQIPMRYAAVYSFFLESYEDAAKRLNAFVDKAARATLTDDVFDDAATGQGLLNYFLRALNCGAITEEEVLVTGLSIEEIRLRSFYRILEKRRNEK